MMLVPSWRFARKRFAGFEIAMHDPGSVRLRERVDRLERVVGDLGDGEDPPLVEDAREVRPVEVLEDHVRRAGRELPDVEDAGDVVPLNLRRGARLVHEAGRRLLGAHELSEEELHGDALV